MKLLTTPFKRTFSQHFSTAIDVAVIPLSLFFAFSILVPAFEHMSFGLPFCWYFLSGCFALTAGLTTIFSISRQSRAATTVCLILFLVLMIYASLMEPLASMFGGLGWWISLWPSSCLLLISVERFAVTPITTVEDGSDLEPLLRLTWRRRAIRLGTATVAAVAISVIVTGIYVHGRVIGPQLAAMTWSKTQGELIEVKPIADHRWNMQLDVSYRYEVDGIEYFGTRDRGLLSRHGHEFNTAANERVGELSQSKQIDVFFDSSNPSESMLMPGMTADGWMGILKSVFYFGFAVSSWWFLLSTRHAESNRLQIIDTPPWIYSLHAIGFVSFIGAVFYFLFPGVSSSMFFLLNAMVIVLGYAISNRLYGAQAKEDAMRESKLVLEVST